MVRSVRAFFLIASVLAAYGWQWLLVRATLRRGFGGRWAYVHESSARRLAHGFAELRGVFIKLGQVISVLGGFLPPSYREALQKLQDQVPARPFSEVELRLVEAFGPRALERFASFEREPIAAASLAQVHKATLADGRSLAVKVLYPGIERLIVRDLFVLRLFLPIIQRVFPIVRFERVLAQLSAMLARETDYANEWRNMERLRGIFQDREDVVIPVVVADLTRAGVLSMSFEEGLRISEVLRQDPPQVPPREIARLITDCYFTMLFEHRLLHADPHPGNFLVRPGPRLVILDYGAVEDVPAPLVKGLKTVILGALTRNAEQVLEGAEQMGFVAPGGDRELLREVGRAYLKALATLRVTDFSSIDRGALHKLSGYEQVRGRLREVMRSVEYPDGYFYVERTLALLFGLVGQLEPERGLPGVAAPLASKMMLRSLARSAAPGPRTAGTDS
ncbi:MAG TPA: AarF/UbiB family protein [Polyangiaceae bacterium]|nr:AarF/UbiB family protein [Polyangiaceae bacterium]